MYHKAIWPNCYHSHYKAQPNTHTKPYKVPNTKPQVGLWILGGLKMWGKLLNEQLGGYMECGGSLLEIRLYMKQPLPAVKEDKIINFLTLYLDMWNHPPPEVLPSTPGSVFCISHGKETWDFLICIFIFSSSDLAVFVDGDKQAAQHSLNWDFQTNKKKETIYNTVFQNSRCQGILVPQIEPWARAVTVTWNNFITAVLYLH
jgi:hypothetical protein